jgi:hypothetical protein
MQLFPVEKKAAEHLTPTVRPGHFYVIMTPRKGGFDMSKSLEELLLGAENQAAASAAVRRAVARADALGLPRAYEPLPPELQEREERERELNQEAGQDRA